MTSTLRAISDSRGYCTCCSLHHLSGSNDATFGIGICSYALISFNSHSVNGTSTLEPLTVVELDWLLSGECKNQSNGLSFIFLLGGSAAGVSAVSALLYSTTVISFASATVLWWTCLKKPSLSSRFLTNRKYFRDVPTKVATKSSIVRLVQYLAFNTVRNSCFHYWQHLCIIWILLPSLIKV